MIFLAAFLFELIILFMLARALTMHLSQAFYQLGLSEKSVMHILAFLFLPGTFLHEVSHYLMCILLRVKVYGLNLFPQLMGGSQIKMGSLEHQKVDFLRDLFIGSAPFIIGNLILFTLLHFFTSHNPVGLNWQTILVGVVVFEIGNTMFSSKKDIEGSLKFLLILFLIACLAWILGVRVSVEQLNQSLPSSIISIINQANLFLLVPIILDLLIIGIIYGVNNLNNRR